MRRPFIQRPQRSSVIRPRERGVTIALVALAIFSIIAMAGLSIDVGTLYEASAEAQRAADAAALAAARTVSINGLTGDPTNAAPGTVSWVEVCGGASSPATLSAIAVAQQNTVGGTTLPASSITVTYSGGSAAPPGSADCSTLGGAFGVNPVVTVTVTQSSLPTYFSRIWGQTGSTVGATASAEAFNSSNSDTYAGSVVPVQPRCVKPWMVPNIDPMHPTIGCPPGTCSPFVSTTDGTIQNPGIIADGAGIVGERFWLVPDCSSASGSCSMYTNHAGQPQANGSSLGGRTPNLQYLPGQTLFSSVAVPSDGSAACTAVASTGGVDVDYSDAIAGCDQSTQYQCGKTLANTVNLNVNPAGGDVTNGVECLIHASTNATGVGQDSLMPFLITPTATPTYPFQIAAGSSNPLVKATSGTTKVNTNDVITSSTSIVSLPIYDSSGTITWGSTTTNVTIVGFLQVFIYGVYDQYGDMYVAVMNVTGCGNAATGTALAGTSPVPVRLITPP